MSPKAVKLFLVGALTALLAAAWWMPAEGEAHAQNMVGAGVLSSHIFLVTTENGKNSPTFFVVDPNRQRYAMYTQRGGTGTHPHELRLFDVRDYKPDLDFEARRRKFKFPAGGMTPKDVQDNTTRN